MLTADLMKENLLKLNLETRMVLGNALKQG